MTDAVLDIVAKHGRAAGLSSNRPVLSDGSRVIYAGTWREVDINVFSDLYQSALSQMPVFLDGRKWIITSVQRDIYFRVFAVQMESRDG